MERLFLERHIKDNKLHVRVIPQSSRSEIESWDDSISALRVHVKSPADKDKANKELLHILKKELKKKVKILKGRKSRNKIILIEDL